MDFNTEFEPVIGLEVHAQLATKSKIFCRCSTAFDSPVNSNTCPVCAGHPGVLPVLNRHAVECAIRAGLATNCRINSKSVFARKNYFYADLPKGYQISQFDLPICEDGYLEIQYSGNVKRVGIQRIHMEEDAGKSVHMTGYSLVNLNRACVPLIEIVTHPDICSAQEAGAYLRKLHAVLMYIGVNDGNLQEGSFRCDANVSVRPKGAQKLGTRTEIKNVNSFRFVEKAIEYEISRQIEVIKAGGSIVQETRSYDSGKGVTYSLRSKEEAHDYRYFPDPDLLPLVIDGAWVAEVRQALPELPDQKRDRYVHKMGIPISDADVIVASQPLARFFEKAVEACDEPKVVANWVMGELLRALKTNADIQEPDADLSASHISLDPLHLGSLIKLIKSGAISNNIAKTIFDEMFKTGKTPETIVEEKGLVQISDTTAIEAVIDEVLKANATQVLDYKAGKEKLLGFFFGLIMKKMAGKANPQVVNDLLKKKLSS